MLATLETFCESCLHSHDSNLTKQLFCSIVLTRRIYFIFVKERKNKNKDVHTQHRFSKHISLSAGHEVNKILNKYRRRKKLRNQTINDGTLRRFYEGKCRKMIEKSKTNNLPLKSKKNRSSD